MTYETIINDEKNIDLKNFLEFAANRGGYSRLTEFASELKP